MAGDYNRFSSALTAGNGYSCCPIARTQNGRTATVHRARHGRRKRLPALSAHARSRQAGGALRRPLPDHRLRPVEPGELGDPVGLRADPVQVAVAGRARAADLGRARLLRLLRHRGAGADAHGRILVPRHRRLGLPEPPPHRGVPRRRGAGLRRRPHLQDEHPADDRLPLPEAGAIATIACLPIKKSEANQFGIVQVDEQWRVVGFQEKPERDPDHHPRRSRALPRLDGQLRVRARAARRGAARRRRARVAPRLRAQHPAGDGQVRARSSPTTSA